MKKLFNTFYFAAMLIGIISNWAIAQLPFEQFSAYSGNPVVPKTPGTWDQSAVWWANVIIVNDSLYLTYDGTSNFPTTPASIGLAVSSDGFTFSKSLSNPILSGDGSGFDAYSADAGILFFDNAIWYMYYAGKSVTISQPGDVIGRATSNVSPHGPWTRNNDTLLTVGSVGEWDSEFILPTCIIKNGNELIMYSFAGSYWPGPGQIGMATSIDGGATWQKYDDPTTTSPPYAESDPALKPDRPYDNFSIWGCAVLKTLIGWEMLYAGENNTVGSICYATSVDGINWVKDSLNNPIFVPSEDPLAYYDLFEKPAVVLFDNKFFMYYDYGVGPNSAGIGLATANIVSVSDEETIPTTFSLEQNYPNPFNPVTNFQFSIINRQLTILKVYDVLGREVATLVNEVKQPGTYTVQWDASGTASGVYVYRLQTGSLVDMKKLILLK